jgi:hypothetical protein
MQLYNVSKGQLKMLSLLSNIIYDNNKNEKIIGTTLVCLFAGLDCTAAYEFSKKQSEKIG